MAEKVGDLYYDVTLETGKAVAESRRMQQENARTGSSFDALTPKLHAITSAIGVMAAAMALVKVTRLADEMRMLGARVEVAAGSVEKGAEAMSELQRISARTQTEIAANAAVFNRLNQSILQMGGAQTDTLRITELLGKAVKVSGASGVEASSAMTQFGQALGSGKLAGDELRSLLENAPYLMRQLADGLGVPIGALKQLGEDGKLTADVVVNALSSAAGRIDADFKKLPATFEGAMAAASDAAARANEALDTLTGTSAALTGATRGVGEVLDLLAEQFKAAQSQSDRLGRSDSVKSWAEATANALTYVADGADFIVRGFRQMGSVIGGVAASIGALARGELGQARDIMKMMAADVMAIGSGPLSGQRIREMRGAAAANRRTEDRGFAPHASGSTLRAAGGAATGKKAKGKFDGDSYMAGLVEATLEGVARIDAIEREALRKNAELLKQGKINREQAASAEALIMAAAAQERAKITSRAELERLAIIERLEQEHNEKNERAAKEAEERGARGASMARGIIGGVDPLAGVRFEYEEKLRLLDEWVAEDERRRALYTEAKLALEEATAERIAEIRRREVDAQAANAATSLAIMGKFTEDVYGMLQTAGRQQTALAKAMFLASKAIAVSEILLQTEVAAAKATGQLGIYGIPMATLIRAQGYASAGMVGGLAVAESFGGGRQYGGPATAGTLYRVNETGRPEMFTAANGAQYMLPTASGNVTPADKVGGGAPTIIINNAPPGTTARYDPQRDQTVIDIAVAQAEARVASGIAERNGPVWRNLSGTTNVRGQQ